MKKILLFIYTLMPVITNAYDFKVDGIYYVVIADGEVEVNSGDYKNVYSGAVSIPSSVAYNDTTYSVTRIQPFAFLRCTGLTSITIPYTINQIGISVFEGCSNLESIIVDIANEVYDSRNGCNAIIETSTNTLIAGCKNTIIPNSVTGIRNRAFIDCFGLSTIYIPGSVANIDGRTAFCACPNLASIIVDSANEVYDSRDGCNAIIETSTNTLTLGCKNTIIPNSVTNIGGYAFDGCIGLSSISFGNSVAYIGGNAFKGCTSLSSITCYTETPPDAELYSFEDYSATLHVLPGCKAKYESTVPWSKFENIVEDAVVDSIKYAETVSGDADGKEYIVK